MMLSARLCSQSDVDDGLPAGIFESDNIYYHRQGGNDFDCCSDTQQRNITKLSTFTHLASSQVSEWYNRPQSGCPISCEGNCKSFITLVKCHSGISTTEAHHPMLHWSAYLFFLSAGLVWWCSLIDYVHKETWMMDCLLESLNVTIQILPSSGS